MIKVIKKIFKSEEKLLKEKIDYFNKKFNNSSEEDIYLELVFCLCTPQSKAKTCWDAVIELKKNKNFLKFTRDQIAEILRKKVRFHNNKAKYIFDLKKIFIKNDKLIIKKIIKSYNSNLEIRDFLVKKVKGLGYKEASHFLRNIGKGDDLAILDRHILKNLKLMNIILDIPKNLSKKKYFDIENRFRIFSKNINIPLQYLDLIFWSKETGEIFK